MQKKKIRDWSQCKRLLQVGFGTKNENTILKYSGLSCLVDHAMKCIV
jgi:hypothetical protein